jgi:hypothetical protein
VETPSAPPFPRPGIPKAADGTVDTGCNCQTADKKKLGPGQSDWPQDATSQDQLWTWWMGLRNSKSASWTKMGNFTNSYNCSGYIYHNSAHWVDAVGTTLDYVGNLPGCWKPAADGTIRISTVEAHVCYTNYVGKAGSAALQDHNDDLYGEIPNRFSKVP